MARPGLLDGLKRWKVPDGNTKQLGRFIVEKYDETWAIIDEPVDEMCPAYSWKIQHHGVSFSIHTGSYVTYVIQTDSFISYLQLVADGGYQIGESYNGRSAYSNGLTLEEVKSSVVEWFRRNRIAELIPNLIV